MPHSPKRGTRHQNCRPPFPSWLLIYAQQNVRSKRTTNRPSDKPFYSEAPMGTRAIPPALAGLAARFTILPAEATQIAASLEIRDAGSQVCRWRGR